MSDVSEMLLIQDGMMGQYHRSNGSNVNSAAESFFSHKNNEIDSQQGAANNEGFQFKEMEMNGSS